MAHREPRNTAHYWWDRRVPGLSLMHADFTTHAYPPHTHEALVVAVTETGGSIIKSRGSIEEAHRSTLFVFNPGEPHSGWMGKSTRWRYRSLYLTRSAIDWVAGGLGVEKVPHFTRNLVADPALVAGFLSLHHKIEEGRHGLCESEGLISAFGRLFRLHGSGGDPIRLPPKDCEIARRVTDIMRARYADPIRLDELSAPFGLTPFQLIRLFKRSLGLTPHAYLTQMRLYAACRELRRGMPIAEAAASAGFYDQSALTRHFKRCYGITPRQFAAAASG